MATRRGAPGGSDDTDRRVAASVDARPELIPVFRELFRGLPSLGSLPRRTAGLPGLSGLGPASRVLDLGCGKGAFALELVRRYGCRVVGVDGCGAFIDEARAAARGRGLEDQCEFHLGDIRRVRVGGGFDAACMLGLDPAIPAARLLRRRVCPGGVYVVDDAYRDPEQDPGGKYMHMPTREEVRRCLQRHGDRIVGEFAPARSVLAALNARLYRRLSANAARVRRLRPDLRAAIHQFLENQRDANRALAGALRPCVWAVRRAAETPRAARRAEYT